MGHVRSPRPGCHFRQEETDQRCLICGECGPGVARHFLTHGVSATLCREHRAPVFLGKAAGTHFAHALESAWIALNAYTARRRKALDTHVGRFENMKSTGRPRPGSYSWPGLRFEAEARFARGEAPTIVIAELRASQRDDGATVPAARTMRRWFAEARWLKPDWEPLHGLFSPIWRERIGNVLSWYEDTFIMPSVRIHNGGVRPDRTMQR